MDFFDLLILAALALPALFRWMSDQSKKKQAPTSTPPIDGRDGDVEAGESEFTRAIREISEALGGQEPADVPAERTEYPREFEPRLDADTGGGFSREESFERVQSPPRTAAEAVPFQALKLTRIETPDLEATNDDESLRVNATAVGVRSLLSSARSAREAVMLSEVLSPPLALRHQSPDERI